ncbi:MAG TPA: cbb3-type cytochrome c oxidase subunit 3 [Cyclobacteriaceae bacterium]
MYNNVLQAIDNIAIWPVVSFVIFFIFFIVLVWWALSADKDFINEMKKLPLNDNCQ